MSVEQNIDIRRWRLRRCLCTSWCFDWLNMLHNFLFSVLRKPLLHRRNLSLHLRCAPAQRGRSSSMQVDVQLHVRACTGQALFANDSKAIRLFTITSSPSLELPPCRLRQSFCRPSRAPETQAELIASPRESGSLTSSSGPLHTARIQMSLRMATTWLPASPHFRHRLLRRLLEKTSTIVRKTWTVDNSWSINTHEFEMVLKICTVVQSSSLGVWPNRCCAGESKQPETCTEHRWQHLNMSKLSESPTTSTMQQSKHMACTSNFTRVFVCHVLRITLFSVQHVQVERKRDRSMITAMHAEQSLS